MLEFVGGCVQFVLTVFIPPVGVGLKVGLSKHLWINIALTLLGYFPGLIHGIWVMAQDDL
jgi:uncharacterized membrane protein YqaE (UPF0057 family)